MPRINPWWKAITYSKHVSSGEPDDAKVSSPVRRGVCGKVPAKVTRHFPTLLYVVAKPQARLAFGPVPTGQSSLLDLLVNDGSQSPLTDRPQDEGSAAFIRR